MDYHELTDRELDALVAERLFGYVWGRYSEDGACRLLPPGENPFPASSTDPRAKDWWFATVPYTFDIGFSWRVVEAMQAREFAFYIGTEGDHWVSGMRKADTVFMGCVATAPTASRAICEAALKALDQESK